MSNGPYSTNRLLSIIHSLRRYKVKRPLRSTENGMAQVGVLVRSPKTELTEPKRQPQATAIADLQTQDFFASELGDTSAEEIEFWQRKICGGANYDGDF